MRHIKRYRDYDKVTWLPNSCKTFLARSSAGSTDRETIRKLFEKLFVEEKPKVRYSLESFEQNKPVKTPSEVWKNGRGHCFESSLFWVACLKYLGIRAWYCELWPWRHYGKIWDHSCVKANINGKTLLMDPGRGIFSARFKKYRQLNRRQTLGNYYINCALMVDPLNLASPSNAKMSVRRKVQLSKEMVAYARIGLAYNPGSFARIKIPFADNIRYLNSYRKILFKRSESGYNRRFRGESARLSKILGRSVQIAHIGSTAVPGLGGKGGIDIIVAVPRGKRSRAVELIRKAGFEYIPSSGGRDRRFFQRITRRWGEERRVHLHLTFTGSSVWQSMVAVRDYLIRHPEARLEYEKVKRGAVSHAAGDVRKYQAFKNRFVKSLEKRAIAEACGSLDGINH